MRSTATREGDIDRMQAWAGQSAALAKPIPAGELAQQLWAEAQRLLGWI
jgi:nitronate monooxygenase